MSLVISDTVRHESTLIFTRDSAKILLYLNIWATNAANQLVHSPQIQQTEFVCRVILFSLHFNLIVKFISY